jgi:hypothetical protein
LIQKHADAQAGRHADTQRRRHQTRKERHDRGMELTRDASAQGVELGGAGFWVRQVEKIEQEEKVRVIGL